MNLDGMANDQTELPALCVFRYPVCLRRRDGLAQLPARESNSLAQNRDARALRS